MRIVHIIPILGCGGAEILLGNIVKKQYLNGDDVLICCLYEHHETFKNFPNRDFILQNIPIYIIKTRVKFSIKNKTRIVGNDYKKLIDDYKPDVIHSHLYEAEILAMSSLCKRVKYISHIHDNIFQFNKFRIKDLISRKKIGQLKEVNWLYRRYKKANSTFLCISKDVFDFVNSSVPTSIIKNVILLRNCIDLQKFFSNEKRNLRTIRIVSVGNLVKKKNHQLLIDIAKLLKEDSDFEFQIDILGYGPLYIELSDAIKKNNLEKHVFLRGNVGNVDQYYNSANLYIHTATYEPFGLVLLEAMASGLPIIALDGKGNRDLIKQNRNGFLIIENNPSLFLEKIKFLFLDNQLYNDISKYCNNFSKQFGLDTYVESLNKIYKLSIKE